MTMLTREQILQSVDLEFENVDVPEWGGSVRVAVMSGTDLDAYQMSLTSQRGRQQVPNLINLRAKLVARTVVDEDGERVFAEADVAALGKKSGAALDRVFEVAQRINGLSKKGQDEIAGNSEAAPSDGSTSD